MSGPRGQTIHGAGARIAVDADESWADGSSLMTACTAAAKRAGYDMSTFKRTAILYGEWLISVGLTEEEHAEWAAYLGEHK